MRCVTLIMLIRERLTAGTLSRWRKDMFLVFKSTGANDARFDAKSGMTFA